MGNEEAPIDFDRIAAEELPQAKRIALWMAAHHLHQRIIDVGCGPGIYTTAMIDCGIDAVGVDIDERMPKGPRFIRGDITAPIHGALASAPDLPAPHLLWDVALSLEVGEHIPAGRAPRYVEFLSATGADTIYFSAARPGQGGEGHINCQKKSYWLRLFCDSGFYLDPGATYDWLAWMRRAEHMGWLAHPELGNGMILRRV